MPDLELPGIESTATPAAPASDAPAAPAAQPQLPLLEDTSTQSASVNVGDQPAPGEPSSDDAPAPRGVQKRIGELRERERIANERADRLEGLVAQMVGGMLSPQQAHQQAGVALDPRQDPRPEENDPRFKSWQEYNSAVVRWEARQVVREQFAEAARNHAQQTENWNRQQAARAHAEAEHALHSHVGAEMRAAAGRIPGYAEAMQGADFDIPLNVEAAIAVSGAVGEVSMYLAKYPHVVRQLAQLPDMVLSAQMARIAHAMRSGSVAVSNAPPPGRVGGSRGTSPLDYPRDATPEQHLEWEARQKKAKAART